MLKAFQKHSILELKTPKKLVSIFGSLIDLFTPAPYELVAYACDLKEENNVQWKYDSTEPVRYSTRVWDYGIPRTYTSRYNGAYFIDSLFIKPRNST